MADIDLKTETPDTSLPATGFLFGADSQSAASPSVYSTQAVATALLGSTSLTGATVTADAPVLNLAQTWNNAAVTFTGLKFNVPTDSSASGSLLMDLQVGGSSKFSVDKTGKVNNIAAAGLNANNEIRYAANTIGAYVNGTYSVNIQAGAFRLVSGMRLGFTDGAADPQNSVLDAFLTRRAAANLRLGAADAAAPVAQTLSVQSVVAGTTNTAGANLTITGSQGTGTGAGGSIVFQVAPAGTISGGAVNALTTALTIDSAGALTVGTSVSAFKLSSTAYSGQISIAGVIAGYVSSGPSISVANNGWLGIYGNASDDVRLYRDNAGILALRNGANAQVLRVYNTTDGTNSEFGKIAWSSNVLQIGTEKAGTGTARALAFQTDGTTRLTIGTNGNITTTSINIGSESGLGALISSPNAIYASSFIAGSYVRINGGSSTSGNFKCPSIDGVLTLLNWNDNGFDRLQFGGTTSSFPAIKRNSTALETKLADDSAYAPHAMQYLDVTDGITAPASATGRARIYVDTADGDLKVIFADGTVKTIVTDT